jgi:hypothetical protein
MVSVKIEPAGTCDPAVMEHFWGIPFEEADVGQLIAALPGLQLSVALEGVT